MVSILFICHGNICRSPMAEFVMRDMVEKAGLGDRVWIASAATSAEELGNPVYPPARRVMERHGLSCAGKTAVRLRRQDGEEYDLLIGMDEANVRNIRRLCGPEAEGKVRLLLDYAGEHRDVADPWYTGDFETTWQDIQIGCRALLAELVEQRAGEL